MNEEPEKTFGEPSELPVTAEQKKDIETSTEPVALTPSAALSKALGFDLNDLKKDDIGPLVVVWSSVANRKILKDARAKIVKATKKKWDGVLLHLRPGETIGAMKLPQVEALYEALMSRWDPDLHRIRMARKTAALAEAAAAEKAAHDLTANQVADHLATLKQAAELKEGAEVLKGAAHLEAVKDGAASTLAP